MVKITKVKSGSIYEEKESYSRIVAVDDWIFVSNTAGRNYKTREMSTDAVEQAVTWEWAKLGGVQVSFRSFLITGGGHGHSDYRGNQC